MLLKMPRKILAISFTILFVFGLIFGILALQGIALARVGSTNILRVWDGNVWHLANDIVGRYLAYFSPANLFVREPLEPTTVVPGLALFLPFEFFGFAVGIILFVKSKVVPKLLKILLFLGPLPSAITWNWFQPGRGLTIFFFYTICVAFGFTYLLSFIKKPVISYVVFSMLIIWATINVVLVFNSINIQLPALIAGN